MTDHLAGFARYLQVLEGLSPKSVEVYCSKVKEFFTWLDGSGNAKSKSVEDITRQDIEQYLEWCFYRGNSNQTRHTKLTALGKFFRFMRYEKTIPEDITSEIPKPKIFTRRMQTFTKEEILNFFRAIDITAEKGIRDCCIFILAAFCGLRISEIYKLQLGDIIDDGKTLDIALPEDICKKHTSRTIYVWKAPAMFIRQYVLIRLSHGAKIFHPFLITYKNKKPSQKRMDAGAIDHVIKTYAVKAGIRKMKITCHMFRATHANDLQHIKGYTLPAIQERMGWKDLSTAGRYLIRRERVHKIYNSLHEYWIEFTKIWKGDKDADRNLVEIGGNAIDLQT